MNTLDQLLAFHCAPTLFRLKPANLIAHHAKDDFEALRHAGEKMSLFESKDIYIEKLCGCDKKALTLVYRKSMLIHHLNQPENWGYLLTQGYPMEQGFEAIIRFLKRRVLESGGFPHEIGVFLGYPLVDVIGFIKNKGQNCKMCGYWKVYGDVEEAKSMFGEFTRCRDALMAQLTQGVAIEHLVAA